MIFESFGLTNRFFVAGLPEERLDTSVHLIIEGELSTEIINRLTQHFESALSKYQNPKSIRWVKKFAETATQKIDRNKTIQSLE